MVRCDVVWWQGRPHTIRCLPVKCFPQPSFTWALAEKGRLDEHPTPVITSHRIQIDEHGNNNSNSNNSHDNVYGAVIMTKVIARVQRVHPVHR